MDDEQSEMIAMSLSRIADAITANAMPGRDETGGTVMSMTEAVMGNTAAMINIASSIQSVADALENMNDVFRDRLG